MVAMGEADDAEVYTRRQFLLMRAINEGAAWPEAMEAVDSTLMSHPDWDREETRTYSQWVDGWRD